MEPRRIDMISRQFAQRRLSRREMLARSGAGLAAGSLAAAGLSHAAAQEATPAAPGSDTAHGPTMLFVQSFQSGNITPKEGESGTWTLTLEQGLGQTLFFSDRPDRVVGAVPTPQFLDGLGFPKENPPNAALLFEDEVGNEDVSVIELFNPQYDEATHTATYDIQLLDEYARLGMTLQQQPTEPADAKTSFGAAHLFIDDCPDGVIQCVDTKGEVVGEYSNAYHDGYCFSWYSACCLPCAYWEDDYATALLLWSERCNFDHGICGGWCEATNIIP